MKTEQGTSSAESTDFKQQPTHFACLTDPYGAFPEQELAIESEKLKEQTALLANTYASLGSLNVLSGEPGKSQEESIGPVRIQ